LGTNETAKANFAKNVSPELVEFCKCEAMPVEVALFGASRNHTIEGRLSKDSSMTALLALGRAIHRQWAAEDKAAAEAARKTAEETLRKLEANAA